MQFTKAIAAAIALLAACGGSVTFQGRSHLAITGTEVAKVEPPRVEVTDTKIEIHEKIQFEYSKAIIRQDSFQLMDEIVDVIKKHPELKQIRIEGHASADGNARFNRTLSAGRAKAVMRYLVDHGVPAGQLVAVGYGADKPVADNTTAEGREQNRRVEFTIMDDTATAAVESNNKRGAL